jgi:pimeloyl-ACP methyl ester carboxylesterase
MQTLFKPTLAAALAFALGGCGGGGIGSSNAPPQLAAAVAAPLVSCASLATQFTHPNAVLTSAAVVAAGTLSVGNTSIGEHCRVDGKMNQRISAVDGQTYATGFERRLPKAWNGRFFYQANGGTDGVVATAVGAVSGGGPVTNALSQGFAVISSDAGHSAAQNPLFGIDPQARLDYGYQAVARLTPMAKALITAAYGKGPDRSYIGGTSNGGRHAMVAASRTPTDYDGFLAVAPGINLPKSAVVQLYGAQQYLKVATDPNNLETAFPLAERNLVARAILARCDALDGVSDGLVEDVQGCRAAFDLARDVPTCATTRDGSCLTDAQKTVLSNVYSGARNSKGELLYSRFPFDPGLTGTGWAEWKFRSSVGNTRNPVSVGFIFMAPPASPSMLANTRNYALNYNLDTDAPGIFATTALYPESAMSFMAPPNPTKLQTLRNRGAKLLVVHGSSDPVFSVDDSTAWYEALTAEFGGDASDFARFFRVPGMGHSSGGPGTDQFDALSSLVSWVEKGQAPDSILATTRGAGNVGGVNPELPSGWAANRTRPLCPYPRIARYNGAGSTEQAENFSCR